MAEWKERNIQAVPLSENEKLFVKITYQVGREEDEGVDIRVYNKKQGEQEFKPTKRGVRFPVSALDDLILVLGKLKED